MVKHARAAAPLGTSSASSRRAVLKSGVATVALMAFAGSLRAADEHLHDQPWAKWDYSKDKPVRGGILRTASSQYIGKLNPNHWPVLDWLSMNLFHEKLVITDGSFKPTTPWLLEEVHKESETSFVTKLRPDITFQDGTKLTANTIKSQIDWIREPKNTAWTAAWLGPLDTVEVIDELTVRWKTKEPWAGFQGVIANVPGYMMSQKALTEDAEKYEASAPKGTGAYIVEEASPGNFLKLKRNPDWWFAKASGNPDMPYFDGVLVSVIPDPAVRLANLRAGKLDILGVDKSQYAIVRNDPQLKVFRQSLNHVVGIRFNTQKGVLKDIRLRQAINHAIDRKALIAGTQFGLGRVASGMYPEDHWAHNPALNPAAYDPVESKKLLADAGYANGLSIKGYWDNTTGGQAIAEAVKSMLGQVGINWQVELLAPVALAAKMKDADYDMAQGGWPYIYDPDLPATGLYHPAGGFNFGRSNNPQAIELIEAGRRETDIDKRQKIYWELERVLTEANEDAWLWWEEGVLAMRKNVMGWDNEEWKKSKESYTWSHPLWFKDGKQ
ncbi:ABC transporter substrate-binding protein [Bradyrhizobium sp. NAS80.1]|uniref:ABC transporter substrate-binding protein n=1 Tax=Bradyrhizobium sp. NAS80.1 TaxID=1680159 RepID=UPI00143D9D1C|nr:ABC transporter substrate-binding protein [Bradyrhizobium sp. NAS80.1]